MSAAAVPDRQELLADAFFRDPYPYYARMRSAAAPYWLPHAQNIASPGILLFSRYDDAQAIFVAARGISKNLRAVRPGGAGPAFDKYMLHRDGADHRRLRGLVGHWFTTHAATTLKPLVAELARELLLPLLRKPECELVAEFCEPLPLRVVGRLVGVPAGDMPRIRAWTLALNDGFDSLLCDAAILQRQQQAMAAFETYIEEQIVARRARPDASLLGVLAQARDELDHEELVAMVGLLLLAGHETTVNLIASAVYLLLATGAASKAGEPRDQWALLRAQPQLIADAIEETLRFESPTQRSSFRLVESSLSINGHTLEPGQQVGVIIGSANRDERVFAQADTFDIRRRPNRHLAFGGGLHNCLGQALARAEAQVALQVLLEHLPAPALGDAAPDWRRNSFFRGLRTLRLRPGTA